MFRRIHRRNYRDGPKQSHRGDNCVYEMRTSVLS
jgi:hypothetical protein